MTTEYPIPTDPEERERWRRDPPAYEAMERLHDASDELIAALDDETNATGMLFAATHEPLYEKRGTRGDSTPPASASGTHKRRGLRR